VGERRGRGGPSPPIGEAALADVNPRTSWRASKEFRIQLVKELSARALREAARKGGADV